MERFRLGDSPILYPNVNWYDYLMNKAAVQTQHNVSISGGTKDIRYFVSLGFLFQNGLFKQLDGLDYDNNYNRQIKKFPTEKQNVSLKHILT